MNQVILIGNLGKDPELRYTQTQKAVASFSVATSEGKETQWHNVIAWEKQAELAAKFLSKGKKVAVTGSIQYRHYEDKTGAKKYITEIIAHRLEFLTAPSSEAREPQHEPAPISSAADISDYIPF